MTEDEIRDMETMEREFDFFAKMYNRPSVTGVADLEAKYQYWIDLGASRERERLLKLLKGDTE